MTNDDRMPTGWHLIKSVLLDEMATAANFHLCNRAADALFHARLIGENIVREQPEQRRKSTAGGPAMAIEQKARADAERQEPS